MNTTAGWRTGRQGSAPGTSSRHRGDGDRGNGTRRTPRPHSSPTSTSSYAIAAVVLSGISGHETTAGGTGLALRSFDEHRSQWELLRSRPDLLSNAVEEVLRYDSPGQGTARVVMADASFGETPVAAGNFVLGYIGAANRDPEVYAEPDTLDITRDFADVPRPATWGGGAHFCMGRNLALQEFEIVLETMLTRCPDYRVHDVEFRSNPLMRGLERLEISW